MREKFWVFLKRGGCLFALHGFSTFTVTLRFAHITGQFQNNLKALGKTQLFYFLNFLGHSKKGELDFLSVNLSLGNKMGREERVLEGLSRLSILSCAGQKITVLIYTKKLMC